MSVLRLRDLEPQLVKLEYKTETWTRVLGDPATWKPGDPTESVTGPREYNVPVEAVAEADGISFLCPWCFECAGRTAVGVHGITCWTPKVPGDVAPGPGRWALDGTSYDDLSLVAGSSSVKIEGGCNAHFFVERGAIRFV